MLLSHKEYIRHLKLGDSLDLEQFSCSSHKLAMAKF